MPESILLVNNSRETFTSDRSGAIATCLWEVCRAADRSGVKPHVVSRRGDGTPYDWSAITWLPSADVAGVHKASERLGRAWRRLSGWARPGQRDYAIRVARVARSQHPHVVIVNNDPEVAAYLRRSIPDAHVVHWYHNLELAGSRFRRRIVLDGDIWLVAVSDYLARAVENVYGLTPFRVSSARSGVDSDRIRPGGAPHDVPVVGYLGRVAVEKGVDVLLEACALVADRGVPFALELVGDTNWGFSDGGPYGQSVARGVERLQGRGVAVSRLGHVPRDEIPVALNAIDVQVVPSRWDEPLGLVVLEGMAAGVAVVASASGGIPEVLWGAGRLVPRDDPAALADVLEELLLNEAERRRLGEAARSRAERFTWDATWAALMAAVRAAPASAGGGVRSAGGHR